jgi:hypothetical protein
MRRRAWESIGARALTNVGTNLELVIGTQYW